MSDTGTRALVRARLAAQGLTRPDARAPEEVVGRLLAVQAQDLRAARLAVRSRSRGLTAADVDAALTDGRLVVSWLCRGTLHLVRAEDMRWLHALTTPQLAVTSARRLKQEGVSPAQAERGIGVVAEAVRAGPRTRRVLGALLDDAGVPTAGQALVHVLLAATLAGHLVRGPVTGGEQAFVHPDVWLGPAPPVDRPAALAMLARRYLRGHGPAAPEDLAAWAGITLGDARRAFAALGGDIVVDRDGVATPSGAPRPRRMPAPRLLGGFDPVLHGWASREPLVGGHRAVVTSNGIFRPTALVDGRVVATWGLAGARITIRPLEAIPEPALSALTADAADVHRFLGISGGAAVGIEGA